MNLAFSSYEMAPSPKNQERMQAAKNLLYESYQNVEAEELEKLVNEVIEAENKTRHGDSWKIINSITGRKNGQKEKLKGESKESRLNSW